jgi:hypothetical protein
MDEKNYDYINPQHYKNYSFEALEIMVAIYGKQATAQYCEMTAFKYRMRMGTKPENSVEQDLEKEKWFLEKAKELRETYKQ